MSKSVARNTSSYRDEEQASEYAVTLLKGVGFSKVRARKIGQIKLVDAVSRDGKHLTFWVKVGWSQSPHAAVMFGLFGGPEGRKKSDDEFIDYVGGRTNRMRERGVTHALLVRAGVLAVAMEIDQVAKAYREQIARFPREARNTKSPTMMFYDPRASANPDLTHIVIKRAIPLELLARRGATSAKEQEARSRMAEIELRVAQKAFRERVGERCGWRCAVTGSTLREVLDAAHLKGKNWRKHNAASDGILLRVDIHRLWDSGLATISGGKFRVKKIAMAEYGYLNGASIEL